MSAKDWAKETMRGLWTTPMIPIKPDGEVDFDGIRHNVDYVIQSKASGIGLGFSEPWVLSLQERKDIFETFIKAAKGRIPCYIHAVDYSVPETISLINHVKDLGADAVMLWVPMEFAKSQQEAYDWYAYVDSQVEMPIMAYNTYHSNIDLTIDNVKRIADLSNVCALKEANNDFTRSVQSMAAVGDKIVVGHPIEKDLPAMAMHMNMKLLLGSTSVYLLQSPKWQPIYDYFAAIQRGDNASAWEQFYALQPLRDLWNSIYEPLWDPESAHHPIVFIKRWMDRNGMKGGTVRAPMHQATEAQLEEFDARLDAIDLFHKLSVA